jgi:hypothetical protein
MTCFIVNKKLSVVPDSAAARIAHTVALVRRWEATSLITSKKRLFKPKSVLEASLADVHTPV